MRNKSLAIVNSVFLAGILAASFWVGVFFIKHGAAADDDAKPPKIAEIIISDVTATSSVVTWNTDEKADSIVNFGLDKSYGIARDPFFTHTSHKIQLPNLKTNTTYYFRVISSDANGNQSISGDYSFTTASSAEDQAKQSENKPAETAGPSEETKKGLGPSEETKKGLGPNVEEGQGEGPGGSEQKITQEVLDLLEKIQNSDEITAIADKINEMLGDKTTPPEMVGSAPQLEIGTDYAVFKWQTDREANSMIGLVDEGRYDPVRDDPYLSKQGEPLRYTLVHEVRIEGLSPATTYHYQVISQPQNGPAGRSHDFTFRTKSVLPEIFNLRASKVEEDSATIVWTTNVPTSAILEYTNLNTKDKKLAGNSSLITSHSIQLNNLVFDTTYSVSVNAENEYGEKASSSLIAFTTRRDQYPPVISKVNTEATLYPGTDNKVQTIVSWETDEPAKCQFFYQQGIVQTKDILSAEIEADFTTKHVQVVTSFAQATVYKYWIDCADDAKNKSTSDSFTILTPAQEQSIIDLIISNFESTFGWLKRK